MTGDSVIDMQNVIGWFGRGGRLRRVLGILLALMVFGAVWALGVNFYVQHSGGRNIVTADAAAALSDIDCIIVLGCKVEADGRPAPMLTDRLETGIALYQAGAAPKMLMSGDHGRVEYDEVNAMKQYAIDAGVPSSDIFMDHAGFSTYETMYRARAVFGAERVLVVTQEYHLYRALYLARALGLEAYGVAADQRAYPGAAYRECREILARNKDFLTAIFQPQPTYLGDMIPVSGDGDQTNDT